MLKDELNDDEKIKSDDMALGEVDDTATSNDVDADKSKNSEELAIENDSDDKIETDELTSENGGDAPIKKESEQKEGLATKSGSKNKFANLLRTPKRKMIAALVALIVVIGIILAIPTSRYAVIGIFIKRDATIVVTDATTRKLVSQAKVVLGSQSVSTSSDGVAKFSQVPTGEYTVTISKKYYKDTTSNYTVPSFSNAQSSAVTLSATGRQIEMSVVNKITKQPLAKALIKVGDTSGETDEKGIATIVLPADKQTIVGNVSSDGYNTTDITATVAESSDANKFSITPTGRIAYLSKITGKINLMTANLDGSDSKVLIAGTGNEKDNTTSQLAARDWNYVALQAHRASDSRNQLYIINTKTGDIKTADAGDVDLQLVGWSGHKFLYEVIRSYETTIDRRNALKSYDADTGKLTTIDESQLNNGNSETITDSYIVDGKVVYSKGYTTWAIMSANADGSGKKTVKSFPQGVGYNYLTAKAYEPGGIYYRLSDNNGAQYFEYEDGAVKSVSNVSDDDFYNEFYLTYLLSPSDKKTFWFEPRDGKNTLFVGDDDAKNPKTLASLSEFSTYGWYGDDYVLLSKNNSELYIASANETLDMVAPLKVTDYHKPTLTYPGYGSGYGGI